MNLGPMEILFILVVALVLFGPTRLPELGKSLGKGIREFRRGTQGLKDELELSLKDAPAQGGGQTAAQPQAAAPQAAAQPMPEQQVVYAAAPGAVTPAAPVTAPAPAAAPLRASDLAVAPVVRTPAEGSTELPAPDAPASAPAAVSTPHRA